MNHETRQKVKAWAKEKGWPEPSAALTPIAVSLIVLHKLSAIADEMDETVDRIMLLNDRTEQAIHEGNLTAVLLLKERRQEEMEKLAAYERLLDREAPMKKEAREGEITDVMIQRAREYPFEDLLPEQLRRGRCRCPIHAGKNTMSFSVKDNRGKCWSCQWEGDTIKYVMDTQGKSFPEAVRSLN